MAQVPAVMHGDSQLTGASYRPPTKWMRAHATSGLKSNSMRCPGCNSAQNTVTDSRHSKGENAIRRRRACFDCGLRWTTKERCVDVEEGLFSQHAFLATFTRLSIEDRNLLMALGERLLKRVGNEDGLDDRREFNTDD